jgi:DNA replication and repair protein RecF
MFSTLRLQNFRSYSDQSLEFDPGVNIIVGPNASGKTNLIEALLMLCSGKSYRADDASMVAHGTKWARLDADTDAGERVLKMIEQPNGSFKKEYTIQGTTYSRPPHQKLVPVVLFEPNHLQSLASSPEMRRDYLDDLITQIVPGYGATLRQYKRTLRQRNALLKQTTSVTNQMFVWNIRLGQLGGQIAEQRMSMIETINKSAEPLYRQLSKTDANVSIRYQSSCLLSQYSSDMLHKLDKGMEQDVLRGFTSYGPHRDDMIVELANSRLQEAASRGEIRTTLLVLKIIELRIIEASLGQKPILLLDDVFSELDGARRHSLTEALTGQQTFITTTDADIVVQHFMTKCRVIPIEKKE